MTDLIILCAVSDREHVQSTLERVWRQIERDDLPLEVSAAAGGNKRVQACVFLGAHNYLQITSTLPLLFSELGISGLASPEGLSVLVKDEHWETWRAFGPGQQMPPLRLV